jgi:hypothetical protein
MGLPGAFLRKVDNLLSITRFRELGYWITSALEDRCRHRHRAGRVDARRRDSPMMAAFDAFTIPRSSC